MRLHLLLICLLLSAGASAGASAGGDREPNPEFGAASVDLAGALDPQTDLLVEPEKMAPRPQAWQVVTSEWLRQGCTGGEALLLAGAGEATATVSLPGAGRYRLWVRSHGAANRGFGVSVNGERSAAVFGNDAMNWRAGGEFDLPARPCEIRLGSVVANPYCDALLLTRDLTLQAEQLGPLRAWAGDERWGRAGEPIGFTGRYSTGRIQGWRWDFGEGEPRTEREVSHTYARPGDYTCSLTLTGRDAKTQRHSVRVHVLPATDFTVARLPLRRSGSPRFGDLDGDGEMDFLVGDPYRSVDAYRHDGALLWSYDSPPEFATPIQRREHPMVIWPLRGQRAAEVAMWRYLEGREWLCLCDGMTGAVLRKVPWPLEESYINGRLAVGNLTGTPGGATLLVFGGQFIGDLQQADAYTADLTHLWSYSTRGSDRLGHFLYSAPVAGDTCEEAFVSGAMIRADGTVGWERPDLRGDHADSIRVGDLNGDGATEVVCSYSSLGVQVLDAATGRTLWQQPTNHAQQLEIGDVRPDVPGLEVIVGDRFYLPCLRARLLVFSCGGQLLGATPDVALTGNPNLGVLQWDGAPGLEIAWANLVLDGRGQVLAVLPSHLHHAFDFTGDGKEEFVGRSSDAAGQLWLVAYGLRGGKPVPRSRSEAVLRKAANHTHY